MPITTFEYKNNNGAPNIWQNTLFNISTGDQLYIHSFGKATGYSNPQRTSGTTWYSPAGAVGGKKAGLKFAGPEFPVGCLVGRIGSNGTPFLVGEQYPSPSGNLPLPRETGDLWLAFNDTDTTWNAGEITVLISKTPLSALHGPFNVEAANHGNSWLDTGIDLTANNSIRIWAKGEVTFHDEVHPTHNGPDGPAYDVHASIDFSNVNHPNKIPELLGTPTGSEGNLQLRQQTPRQGALIGKRGDDGQAFFIGSNYQTGRIPTPGNPSALTSKSQPGERAAGHLFLGYNDSDNAHNRGFFEVYVMDV